MKIILGNKYVLDMHISHNKGKYNLYVHKVKEHNLGGITISEYSPFDEGNFCFTLLEGRKSSKKLEKMNTILFNKKDVLLDLWQNKQYNTICSYVYSWVSDL